MRYTGSWMNAVVLLLALVATGCRLPFRDGSVPQSVTDCRRLSQQGVTALERGQAENAEALLAKAVAACPVDGEARRHYAEALWRRGAHKEAIDQLQQSGRLIGDDASLSVRLAEMQLADNQLEPARQNAEQALTLDPKLPSAWAVRGGVMRAAGQPQQALADNLRALGYAPGDRTILLEIAELHRQLNQPDRALHTLQTLADTYSPGEEPGQVLYLMGMAYSALGRHDDSLESLKAAVAKGKPTPEMFYGLGEAQLLAGHPAEAAEAARHALSLQPQHQPSRALLDRIELAQRPQGTVK
jgi:tetratricopeptide (TPR) repeat protein